MASGIDSSSNPGSEDPYTFLGLEPGATFDEVQKARERMLLDAGEDSKAKSKIESSYDALLMESCLHSLQMEKTRGSEQTDRDQSFLLYCIYLNILALKVMED